MSTGSDVAEGGWKQRGHSPFKKLRSRLGLLALVFKLRLGVGNTEWLNKAIFWNFCLLETTRFNFSINWRFLSEI